MIWILEDILDILGIDLQHGIYSKSKARFLDYELVFGNNIYRYCGRTTIKLPSLYYSI